MYEVIGIYTRTNRKYKPDIDGDITLDELLETVQRFVGINDVINKIVIEGETDTGEPYKIIITKD